jgi:hypothetical protein
MDKKSKNLDSASVMAGSQGHLAKSEDSVPAAGDPSKGKDIKPQASDMDKNQSNVSVSKQKRSKISLKGFFGCLFNSNYKGFFCHFD